MNIFKQILRFFPNKFVRKYIGGYWEYWMTIKLHRYWLNVTEEDANNINYAPPTALPDDILAVEYYPYNFFGRKCDFNKEVKTQNRREQKLKRILNEKI